MHPFLQNKCSKEVCLERFHPSSMSVPVLGTEDSASMMDWQLFKSWEEAGFSTWGKSNVGGGCCARPSFGSHQLRRAEAPPWRVHWCLYFSSRAQDDCPALRDKSCHLCQWTTSGQSGQGRELLSKVHLQHSWLTWPPRPSWSQWLPWAPWSHRPSWKGW